MITKPEARYTLVDAGVWFPDRRVWRAVETVAGEITRLSPPVSHAEATVTVDWWRSERKQKGV